MKIQKLSGFLAMLFLLIGVDAIAQDTLKITLPEAENRFLQKNLTLLAEKYNIDIAKAQIIQARLYNNPNIQLTGAIYNPVEKKAFDVSNSTGEYVIDLQQVIILAGKRNKQIKLAETGAVLAENKFYDLLRTLQFTLRSDFYKAYFLHNSINAYQIQITTLESLNTTFQELQKKQVVTAKDAIRIKSLLYSLKAEQAGLQQQFNDVQAELQLLLQDNHTCFIPQDNINIAGSAIQQINLQTLLDTAFNNRYDLRLAKNTMLYNQQNYSLQKAMATPDLAIGASFDKRGSFVDNSTLLNVAIDLPFFNRNQGNIKAAKLSIEQSKLVVDQQSQQVENDVKHAYANALTADKMLSSIDFSFKEEFEELLRSVTQNFEKRNISLLEFTDFYDSYKENILQLNEIQNSRIQAIEALNFAVGKILLNNN